MMDIQFLRLSSYRKILKIRPPIYRFEFESILIALIAYKVYALQCIQRLVSLSKTNLFDGKVYTKSK